MPNEDAAAGYSASVIHISTRRFGGASPPGPPLQPPGGGGTYDGMEARVARLEADVGHIQKDVSEIKEVLKGVRTDVSALHINFTELKTHFSYLPTKGYIFTVVAAGVTFGVAALTLLSRLGWLVAGAPK
jgi:hypothetical protein